ncbi:MAG: hypothetical protein AAF183_03655 [Pseudomonadota bacterium]
MFPMLNLPNRFACATALATALALTACTGVSSPEIGGRYDSRTGPVYFMPTTRIPITVSVIENTKKLVLTAGDPVYVPDERHRYRLNSVTSPFHAETATFKVAGGLLNSVELESDGKVDEFIVAATKSAFIFPEAAADGTVILSRSLDVERLAPPDGSASPALAELNDDIADAIAAFTRGDQGKSSFLKDLVATGRPMLEIDVRRSFPEAATADSAEDAPVRGEDCRVGFCYRVAVGYEIRARFYDESSYTTSFSVPNGSPIYAVAVNRGAFVKWHTTATLQNGMLTDYKVETDDSEALAFAKLPTEIVGGMVSGLTQRGDLFDARSTALQSRIDFGKARSAAEKEAADTAKVQAESSREFGKLFQFASVGLPLDTDLSRLNGGGQGQQNDTNKPGQGESD